MHFPSQSDKLAKSQQLCSSRFNKGILTYSPMQARSARPFVPGAGFLPPLRGRIEKKTPSEITTGGKCLKPLQSLPPLYTNSQLGTSILAICLKERLTGFFFPGENVDDSLVPLQHNVGWIIHLIRQLHLKRDKVASSIQPKHCHKKASSNKMVLQCSHKILGKWLFSRKYEGQCFLYAIL